MFKAAGCLLTVISFSLAGMYGAARLKARVKELDWCIIMVQMIADELKYSLTSAEQILGRLCENPLLDGFGLLAEYECLRREGKPFYLAFSQAVDSCRSALSSQDKYVLRDLPLILGRYQAESQLNSLNNIARRLSLQREQAAGMEKTHSRLYQSMGVLGGMALCLLVI